MLPVWAAGGGTDIEPAVQYTPENQCEPGAFPENPVDKRVRARKPKSASSRRTFIKQPNMNIKSFLLLCLTGFFLQTVQTQELISIGRIDPAGKTISLIAQESFLKSAFEKRLGNDGATVSDFRFIWGEDGSNSKYLIIASVKNDPQKINSIGWELQRNGDDLVLERGGPAIEHSCSGDPCDSCLQKLTGRLEVICDCLHCHNCQKPRCNHQVTVVLSAF